MRIGGFNSIFAVTYRALETLVWKTDSSSATAMVITRADAQKALAACTDKTDEQLEAVAGVGDHAEPPSLVAPKVALFFAVVSHLGLERITFVPATGGCAGLMALGEPAFVPLQSSTP